MHKTRFLTGGALFVALIAGLGYAVATERPVAQMVQEPVLTQTTSTSTLSDPNTYTSTQVAQHNTAGNCWTSIEGSVYDLTTWVTRHPGGQNPIIQLCGTDGTASFRAEHKSSRAPRAALALLKIGALK